MGRITAELTSGTLVRLSDGRHHWTGDEPLEAGGTDEGPDPYELLLSSLAACTCVTIAMYCRHKGIVLRSINATYDFDRIHAADCEDCDLPDQGFIEQISSRIHISGELDQAQEKRLAQIARRCPVHKTLAHGVAFDDQVSFD